jgi:hypothetical protein
MSPTTPPPTTDAITDQIPGPLAEHLLAGVLPERSRPGPAPDRPGRVLMLIIGGLLTLALIAGGTYIAVGAVAHEEITATVHFPAGITRIVANLGRGSLTLRAAAQDDISGERTTSRGLHDPHITETVDGTTLELTTTCSGFATDWCGVSYTLDVPAAVTLDATTGSGGITLSGTSGDAILRTGSGVLSVDGATGKLNMETGSGYLRGTNLRGPVVTARAGAGLVRLSFATTPQAVSARTGAGAIDIEVPDDGTAYALTTDTGSGGEDITVTVDPRSAHVIDTSSGAGSVKVHYAGH